MKTVYRIEAWCVCNSATDMDTIASSLSTQLRNAKNSGKITEGKIIKYTIDTPETTTIQETV